MERNNNNIHIKRKMKFIIEYRAVTYYIRL